MAIFEQYAEWYDAFNGQKDYEGETAYVRTAVAGLCANPRRWLDVGCGTGKHVSLLSRSGIDATGLDASAEMVRQARLANPELPFHIGTAQRYGLPGRWDAISMLFHVMSYQTEDDAIQQSMVEARDHLEPQGVFAFDFWHTPAVAHSPPGQRTREATIGGRRLFRTAHPQEDRPRRRIDIRYEFRWDSTDAMTVHEEMHRMRHFTPEELVGFLNAAGLRADMCAAWMTGRKPTQDDWYAMICATRSA